MPNLAQLRAKSARVNVSVAGETIIVNYRPDRFTLGTIEAMKQNIGPDQVDTLVDLLLDILIDWDITDEDDTTLMVSKESLRNLPLRVLNAIQIAVAQDSGDVKAPKPR